MTTITVDVDPIGESRSVEARGNKLRGRVAFVTGSVAQHLSLSVRFVNRQSAQMPDDNNGAYLLERQGGASL